MVDTLTKVLQGQPYSTIIEYAESYGVNMIVMSTHGRRGLKRLLLGSTTERVVRSSDFPVLTIRPSGDEDIDINYPYQNVLVPTDGNECANEALRVGVEVANLENSTLHPLTVVDTASLGIDVRSGLQVDSLEEAAKEILKETSEFTDSSSVGSVSKKVEFSSSIHNGISSYIKQNGIELVVIGTHGRTGFDRYVLGSVTEKLVRTSPVPVLSVRESKEENED